MIGSVTGRRRIGGGSSSSSAPITPTSVGPQTNATNLGSHTRSRSSLSSNPVYIKAGEKRTAVAPTTIKLEGQDLESAIEHLSNNEVLLRAFGEKTITSYLKLKEQELKDFNSKETFSKKESITEWEKLNTLDC